MEYLRKLAEEFNAECEEIAIQCEEQGYPSHGATYDLRVEELMNSAYYAELFDTEQDELYTAFMNQCDAIALENRTPTPEELEELNEVLVQLTCDLADIADANDADCADGESIECFVSSLAELFARGERIPV